MKEVKAPKKPLIFYYGIAMLVLMLLNIFVFPLLMKEPMKEVSYKYFIDQVDAGMVDIVQIEDNRILFKEIGDEKLIYETGVINDPDLVQRLSDSKVDFLSPIVKEASPIVSFILTWVVPIAIFVLLGQFLSKNLMQRMGGTNAMQLGKSNAKIYIESKTGIKFEDVAGQDEAKEALNEIVDFLHNPGKYTEIGAIMPKGALLVGPPGTGKTLLAKAVAGEASVPFFSISGSEFVEMFVGMGAAKVRDLFKQAGEKAPCIVFIDEIDTIGKRRDNNGMPGSNDEREQTLNQLLSEMDGFDGRLGVVILAATNRPEVLDPALLRPGRFDRRIPVELPDLTGRTAILKVHIKKVKTQPNLNLESVARTAAGASGADLANIVNEAALLAVREGRKVVTQEDLEESVEIVIAGAQQKSRVLSDKEKKIVAYHEIGHALVAASQTHSAPVHKITIIPRTSGALGYTMQVDQDEHFLVSREEIENKIATLTGGRSAEELVFGSITTGASNDIEQATKLAKSMITRYGMTDEFGMVTFEQGAGQYLGGGMRDCSNDTSSKIDAMTVDIVNRQHEKARQILTEKMSILHVLADMLYEAETVTGEEFMKVLEDQETLCRLPNEHQKSEEVDFGMPETQLIQTGEAEEETTEITEGATSSLK